MYNSSSPEHFKQGEKILNSIKRNIIDTKLANMKTKDEIEADIRDAEAEAKPFWDKIASGKAKIHLVK